MVVAYIGAVCFGLVVGWVTYRTLRRTTGAAALSDIATVIAAVGGAAVTGLFTDKTVFGCYCIGLAVGFFAYFVISVNLTTPAEVEQWMGD